MSASTVGEPSVLMVVAVIITLGVAGQVLADRYRVPSVLFLILTGVAVGPEGLGLVTQGTFGGSLSTIVGLSVAIIVFEGAFHLDHEKIHEARSAALHLVTVGAALSFAGTTVAAHYLLGIEWGIAGLIGALLIATGPTVVTPILEVVPVRDHVAAALETEGIVNDVTAAILAVVVFKLLAATEAAPSAYLVEFVERLSIGVFVGLAVAAVLWFLLTQVELPAGWSPQNARLMTLAGAILAFSLADTIATESGVAAVAVAGVVLGNADLPFEETIAEFKGDITLVVLSFVFIALATLIEFDALFALGLSGLLLVFVIAVILRPALVFISTFADQFSMRERLFMGFVGPRGIIPASVATLFSIQLQNPAPPSNPAGAEILAGTVFLVIFLTVIFEGGFARKIAETLDVIPMRVLIIGGGRVGKELAERLSERGENVVIIERDDVVAKQRRAEGFTVRTENGTDVEVLRAAGAEQAKTVIAATGDDDTNLLVAQLVRAKFQTEDVIARVNRPDNKDAFEELGVEAVSASTATAWAIDNLVERPALSEWMSELGRSGDVQEVEITDEELVGRSVADINPDLPEGCIIALLTREGTNNVPKGDTELSMGDRLTIIGPREGVKEAVSWFHPHD
ncbi:cation:proton antiporter domain-containing protein [Halodesulfurarchaeum formicicum]|uniref:cation:proton antiporter domain-containing protein n=1 Tax=Halodesulfurarchaeum formicicum TaxID=1873524 RepID=UPI0009036BA3|nr:cation:proton antiporter [Halodesulfurarchaeum formicicum]